MGRATLIGQDGDADSGDTVSGVDAHYTKHTTRPHIALKHIKH